MISRHLTPAAGVGFKPQHFEAIRQSRPDLGFFEVHAENYLGAGGPPLARLAALRREYELSFHGVGLSIGGMERPDAAHLARLRCLCDRFEPESFSEHLAWSGHDGLYLNDLLPVPLTSGSLKRVAAHVAEVQDRLGRRVLIENPATYLRFEETTIPEPAFLAELCRQTGCGLLLDVANIFVSAANLGADARDLLFQYPLGAVGEVHLAGHEASTDRLGQPVLIDTHGSAVPAEVWDLFEFLLGACGPLPALIEWDNNVPDWPTLASEAEAAGRLIGAALRRPLATPMRMAARKEAVA
ncbi:MAG TPA: DUF692 domain-containing protein [Falsiroseomonas sp.]|jgi:hypothetical protein|nr:DUF692 domain-containing protein [Falsiroseomonas sp.]